MPKQLRSFCKTKDGEKLVPETTHIRQMEWNMGNKDAFWLFSIFSLIYAVCFKPH